MAENDKIDAYNNILSNFERILNTEDIIIGRPLALEQLNSIIRQTALLQTLSLEPVFLQFLRYCFDLFFDTEDLEKCVDCLLQTSMSEIKAEKYGFFEVLNKLKLIPKYSAVAAELMKNTGVCKNKNKKRVSWQDDRNEVKFYLKAEEHVEFKHGGYKDKDRYEALAWKNEVKKDVSNDVAWYFPVKLRVTTKRKHETEESREQLNRESKSLPMHNTNPNTDLVPIDLNWERSHSTTSSLPIFDYSVINNIDVIRNLCKAKDKHNRRGY